MKLLYVQTEQFKNYYVSPEGFIARLDMPFAVSGQWIFKGVAPIGPFNHIGPITPFSQLTDERIQALQPFTFKNGKPRYVVFDLDHGTTRSWGDGIRRLAWMEVSQSDLDRTHTRMTA